jgi:hypothetical protein
MGCLHVTFVSKMKPEWDSAYHYWWLTHVQHQRSSLNHARLLEGDDLAVGESI